MRTTHLVVSVVLADGGEITRTATGMPRVDTDSAQAQLFLATPSDAGGWLVETWGQRGEQLDQGMVLAESIDDLADSIAAAVRAIAEE